MVCKSPKKSTRKSPKKTIKGGRRTEEERKNVKCAGENDVFGVAEDGQEIAVISPQNAIRLFQDGKYWCFDAIGLANWFSSKKEPQNPYTRNKFTEAQVEKLKKKLLKLKNAGVDVPELNMEGYFNHGGYDIPFILPDDPDSLGEILCDQIWYTENRSDIRDLIARGANVNVISRGSSSVYWVVVKSGMHEHYSNNLLRILDDLYYAGANFNIPGEEESPDGSFLSITPLLLAVNMKKYWIASKLLRNGANPNIQAIGTPSDRNRKSFGIVDGENALCNLLKQFSGVRGFNELRHAGRNLVDDFINTRRVDMSAPCGDGTVKSYLSALQIPV
jgi:hypothetical protein